VFLTGRLERAEVRDEQFETSYQATRSHDSSEADLRGLARLLLRTKDASIRPRRSHKATAQVLLPSCVALR